MSDSEQSKMNESHSQPFKQVVRMIVFFVPKTLPGPVVLWSVLYWWFVPVSMKVDHVFANPSVWWKIGVSLLAIPTFLLSRIAAEGLASSLSQKWENAFHRVIAPLSFIFNLFMMVMILWLFAPLFGFSALQPKVVALIFCGLVIHSWLEILKNGLGVFDTFDTTSHWLRDVVDLSASELLSRDSRHPIIYLRSFEAERIKATTIGRLGYIQNTKGGFYLLARREKDLMLSIRVGLVREYKMKLLGSSRSMHDEQALFNEYFSSIGPYIAVGRPGESLMSMDVGSAKVFISDDDWRSKVQQLIEAAVVIVIEAADSKGLAWEISEVVRRVQPERVLLVLPRNDADHREFCIFAANIFPHPIPEELPPTRLIMFNPGWFPVALEDYTMILEDALNPFIKRLGIDAGLNISKTEIK